MDEKFGADCNHEGQSFICEPCAAAELARLRAELAGIQNQRVLEITPALIMDYAKAQAEVVRLKAELAEARAAIEYFFAPGPGLAVPESYEIENTVLQITWNKKLARLKAVLEVKDG